MKTQENHHVGEMKKALHEERKLKVEFLKLLTSADQTKWFLEAGYSSLFSLCTSALRLSRSSALKRIVAARASQRFPEILGLLETGKIHLNAIVILSPYFTEENQKLLLGYAENHSEREIEKWLASLFPKEPKTRPKEELKWLDGESAELTLIVDEELLALIERTKELMKHQHPKGETVPLLKDVLKKHLKTIDPLQKKTRNSAASSARVQTRYIQRGIQSAVWKRDQSRCTYISPEGKRCDEKAGLEIDHRQAWAHGGHSDDISNLRLLCFAHNRWLGFKTFGKKYASRPMPGA